MDTKGISTIFIPGNVARTASVQVTDPTTTATYLKGGEMVITDEAGTVLTSATALKAVDRIQLKNRSLDGKFSRNLTIKGSDITSYRGVKYLAPQELVHVITLDDSVEALTNHSFNLMIESNQDFCGTYSFKKTVGFAITTATTKDAIVDGLVAAVNTQFGVGVRSKTTFAIVASKVANGGDPQLVLTSFDRNPPRDLNTIYRPQRYSVANTSFTATVEDNKTADLVYNAAGTTALRMTKGKGSYWEVGTMERTGRGESEVQYNRTFNNTHIVTQSYDAEEFQSDGVTANEYDGIVINYVSRNEDLLSQTQHGCVKIMLPVEDNATSQVNGVATSSIVKVLNKYIVTEYGIGTAFVPTV